MNAEHPARNASAPIFTARKNRPRIARRLRRIALAGALAPAILVPFGLAPRAAAATPALPPLEVEKDAPRLREAAPETAPKPARPAANNSACYVCHVNFTEEPLVRTHAQAGVGCTDCHGESREHAADENNTTPPSILFAPAKIDAACGECHSTHDAPARAVVARWQERCPGKTRPSDVVCTDCHGDHRLKLRTIIWDKQTRQLLVKHQPTVRQDAAGPAGLKPAVTGLFARSNLVAWCIVPFDARKRGPEERAAMLEWLGFTQFAYDYRAEHIPTFDEEMDKLRQYHIRLLAWWFPGVLNDEARLILDVLKRHHLRHVQLWVTGAGGPVKDAAEQAARVEAEARRLRTIAEAAAQQDCTVALYNHGDWFGEPENMIAIIERLKQDGVTNVGIVYNQHHGHEHLDRFESLLAKMKPYLVALNLNGMTRDGDRTGKKILPLGQGDLDLALLRIIRDSGWQGPIGILNHTDEDAEGRLRDNLDGLDWLVAQLDGRPAGPRPKPTTWPGSAAASTAARAAPRGQPSLSPAFGKALGGGLVVEGQPAYRTRPITVECWAKLNSRQGFNVLVASDPKSSSEHWELYSYAGSGAFSVYQPGRGGEFKSDVNIGDGQWHYLAAILEPQRVRLFVDGQLALDKPAGPASGRAQPGGLAFGRVVEGGIGCDGVVDEVRLSRGARAIAGPPKVPFVQDAETLGLWHFD